MNEEMNTNDLLQHKISKYRAKSMIDERHDARLMGYIAQNRAIKRDVVAIGQQGGASVRKGPEQSATLYKVGTKKTGNDGNKWIIVETASGVKRWQLYKKEIAKLSSKSISKGRSKSKSKTKSKSKSKSKGKPKTRSKMRGEVAEKFRKLGSTTKSFISREKLSSRPREYLIHDNGGRPFKVVATHSAINIYSFEEDKNRDWSKEPDYNVHLLKITKFLGYWVGHDTSEWTNFHGNSILVQETKTSYISIGWMVHRFETDEEILDYVSPVGNSDVPYPVAYTKNYVYFMLENEYVRKDQLTTEATPVNADDIYGEFYGHIYPENQDAMKKIRFKKLKLLIKRRW
ncbi:mg989 protein [Yasminevirus sp. GU-2018]|uniref:Mg989 protein n=1 Tax=Yasminevirus sp. GU-2018 TaxID=2420051 RepID=A0A5K0U9U3_9VIRU|nr:mg989 protein [Yasminevirus sp. GU-2018]